MPSRAPTPCRYPGCGAVLATPGFCPQHRANVHQDYGRARRGFDAEVGFYQSRQWRVVRAAFLREHPLCGLCSARGGLIPARVVDHVVPVKDGGTRYLASNLQALCVSCHNRKTARESAGRRVPPGGDESLRLGGGDARACPNFSACKLKQGGIPPDEDIHGRS
jgi:5-methylcytosine-specific restriction protein A